MLGNVYGLNKHRRTHRDASLGLISQLFRDVLVLPCGLPPPCCYFYVWSMTLILFLRKNEELLECIEFHMMPL